MSEQEPQSPCISVCLLDDNDICAGCFRSADEITDWFVATPEQKHEILRRCRERIAAQDTVRLM